MIEKIEQPLALVAPVRTWVEKNPVTKVPSKPSLRNGQRLLRRSVLDGEGPIVRFDAPVLIAAGVAAALIACGARKSRPSAAEVADAVANAGGATSVAASRTTETDKPQPDGGQRDRDEAALTQANALIQRVVAQTDACFYGKVILTDYPTLHVVHYGGGGERTGKTGPSFAIYGWLALSAKKNQAVEQALDGPLHEAFSILY